MKRWRGFIGAAAVLAALAACSGHSDTTVSAGEPTASAAPTVSAAPVSPTPTADPTVTASDSPSPSPSASASSTGLNVRALTAADNGRTLHVAPGQMISVRLAPNAGSYDPPVSDDETVLVRTSHEGGYPEAGDAVARFSALKPGTAHITSQTDLSCMHSNPRCMVASRVFSVTVVVDRS